MIPTSWSVVEIGIIESNKTRFEGLKAEGIDATILKVAENLVDGEYAEIFKIEGVAHLVSQIPNGKEFSDDDDPFNQITQLFMDYIDENSNSTPQQRQMLVLLIGITYLRVFIQSNWTGPPIKIADIFTNYKDIIDFLEVDGEPCYKHIYMPQYLATASAILVGLSDFLSGLFSRTLWAARCAVAHQRVLTGPSDKLRKIAEMSYEKAEFVFSRELYRDISAMICLERGLLFHYYLDSMRARDFFLQAQQITGLKTQLSGALGRRTKFQTFDIAQLVLLAKSHESTNLGVSDADKVPESVPNPDPDAPRLDNTKFTEAVPDADANLSVIDQCIVLALCLDVKNRNPRHGLTWEEMRVYVDRVLKNPNNWMVHSMGLLLHARLEYENSRTIDKACMQIQVLVDQYDSDLEKETRVAVRMTYLHALAFPPLVTLKKELGQKWLSLGSAASAQNLFEQLEMWEEVAECFLIREMPSEAEKLLRSRLEIESTPRLLCTLGDVTGNLLYYEQAWEKSKGRFTRAKRTLGKIAMNKQQWQEAIDHLSAALKVNPQHSDAWFRLGCCALAVNNYTLAMQTFARVVQLHPDDGESWNNLASTHISRGKMKEAFVSLKEAVRFKSESWQIWENLLRVSIDLGEITEAIFALERLLDLKQNYVDLQALALLVKFVIDDIQSGKSVVGNFIHTQLDNLLQKISTKVGEYPDLWDIFAQYWKGLGNYEEAVKQRLKQCRSLQVAGWEDTMPLFKKLVLACQKLTDDQILQNGSKLLYSTRLYLTSVLKKSQNSFEGTAEHEKLKVMIEKITKQEVETNKN